MAKPANSPQTLQEAVGPSLVQSLPEKPPYSGRRHVFEAEELEVAQYSIDAGRALLVSGEPGSGKTQLAEALAAAIGCPLHAMTLNSRTEAGDLFFTIDLVRRLAIAQARQPRVADQGNEDPLALNNFVRPGPFFRALAPERSARCGLAGELPPPAQNPRLPSSVVLIDEIDKAEIDLPSALLEVLGSWSFLGPMGETIRLEAPTVKPPLVLITTNGEKDLTEPFLRRCLTHQLKVPASGDGFVDYVLKRAEKCSDLEPEILLKAAQDLEEDRRMALQASGPKPGLAEYFDMLRVLKERATTKSQRLEVLKQARRFLFGKHSAGGNS